MLIANAITQCLMADLPTAIMVLAQSEAIPLKEENKRWVAVVVALILMICIGFAACTNPKRGHRD